MKIAIVVPPWFEVPPQGYGGIEVLVGLLADGLVDKGHQVTLFTVSSSKTKAHMFKVFDEEMRFYLDAPPSSFLNTALTHSLASYLEISRGEYDIIHDNTWKEGLCSATFMDIPVVHTLHGPFNEENKRFYSLFKDHSRIYFVTISNYQQARLPNLNYVATVYNGINFPEYPYSEKKEDFFFISSILRCSTTFILSIDSFLPFMYISTRKGFGTLTISEDCPLPRSYMPAI